mmetsp:Transcript_38853/g.91446  ORF Transcript_38853/g.91446 Transcript_38853/m.91446 type:complete len:250 (+) Transcript_38853:1069-1818(+)
MPKMVYCATIAIREDEAVHQRLSAQHSNQKWYQQETDKLHPVPRKIARNAQTAATPIDQVTLLCSLYARLAMSVDQFTQCEDVDEDAAGHQSKESSIELVVALAPRFCTVSNTISLQHTLGSNEDHDCKHHPSFPHEKPASTELRPNDIHCFLHNWVSDQHWISILHQRSQRWGELFILSNDEVLDVEVDTAQPGLSFARAPHQAVQQRLKKGRSTLAQLLNQVGVPAEKLFCTMVVVISVSAKCEDIN